MQDALNPLGLACEASTGMPDVELFGRVEVYAAPGDPVWNVDMDLGASNGQTADMHHWPQHLQRLLSGAYSVRHDGHNFAVACVSVDTGQLPQR